jgi:DNA invertase Pin-like site-specific DNA recombinase
MSLDSLDARPVEIAKSCREAGMLASLAELELGRERRAAAREARRARGQAIGRPKALDHSKAALARRMHESGEPVSTIATTLGVSRATVYRVLAEETDETDTLKR